MRSSDGMVASITVRSLQVENFGTHIRSDGFILYGLKVCFPFPPHQPPRSPPASSLFPSPHSSRAIRCWRPGHDFDMVCMLAFLSLVRQHTLAPTHSPQIVAVQAFFTLTMNSFFFRFVTDISVLRFWLQIEAIMDHGADNVSLDLMSRLLMDIQNDSSRIIDSLVSEYQRSMLDVVFYGDRATRDKYNIILSEMITPKMSAELYLDGKEHESEIKQVRKATVHRYSNAYMRV